jgi:hypothetical protein
MTTARRTAFATTVLSLILAAASPGESNAASDAPLRQLRATIHDIFSPPRRARRPKAKQAPAAVAPAARSEVPGARQDRQAAGSRRQSGPPPALPAEAAPVPEPQPRPEAAKARAERVAKLPAAKEAAPARTPTSPAKPPAAKEAAPARPSTLPAKPPAAKEAAPARPSTLPAKPRGRPARTAALPPPGAPAKDMGADVPKPSSDTESPVPPPPGPSACQLRLTPELATVQLLPSVSAGQCTVDDVVRLEAVIAADGRRVVLNPPATLRCPMAEAVIHWVRDELAPAATDLKSSLKAVSVDTSFECRSRNRVKGGKLSEHGHANAIDVRTMTLANGNAIALTDVMVDKGLRERLRQGACSRFTTVLGPGSDGYHESHVHLDLIQRRNGYRMCQWDVRDIADVRPMPRTRPPEAPPRTASTGQAGTRN